MILVSIHIFEQNIMIFIFLSCKNHKKFMFENQVRFEDLGFADTEADDFIDSVLEELYYGDL